MARSRAKRASVGFLAAITCIVASSARADCQPSELLDINPGSSVVCSGTDSDGFTNPAFDIILQDGHEAVTSVPVTNLSISVLAGAVVNEGPNGFALGLVNGGHTVVNDGLVQSGTFGIASDGTIAVTNNGQVSVSGGSPAAISLLGGSTVSNSATGVITADGNLADGVSIGGTGATVTNEGFIGVAGIESVGIGIEGFGATIANTGQVTASGTESEGLGVEGFNAAIGNAGLVQVDGFQSEAIGLEGQGSIVNSGNLVTTGTQSVGIGVLGDSVDVRSSGSISTSGTQSVGIGMIGNTSTLTLNGGSISTNGTGSVAIGLAGNAAPSGTLFRGTGTHVSVGLATDIDIQGDNATGILLFHDNAQFSGFGRLRGGGDGATGLHFAGNSMTIDAAGDLLLSGAGSTGLALGTAHPLLSSATSSNATLTLDGAFVLSGSQSTGVDVAGDQHTVTNNGTIETLPDGRAIRVNGDRNTVTNTGTGVILNGGVELTGDQITFANEGGIDGKGVTVAEGSGQFDLSNTGVIALGTPTAGEPPRAAFEIREGGGAITNDGDITGDASTFGVALQGVTQPLQIHNTANGIIETEVAVAGVGGPDLTILNEGGISASAGIGIAAGTRASVTNTGVMDITGTGTPPPGTLPDALGVQLFVDERATFVNDGTLNVASAPAGSGAVTLGAASSTAGLGQATLTNRGAIRAQGAGEVSGARLLADRVTATNEGGAVISATSGSASAPFWALGLSASNAGVQNDGTLFASGANGRGIGFTAQSASPTFNIINSGRIEVLGANSIGISIDATTNYTLTGAAVPSARVVGNEDTLVVSGQGSRGMVLGPLVNSVRLENAGRFDVAGDDARGIDVQLGDGNFVLNANGFRIAGANAVGIAVTGDGNTVMNGQDAAVFPATGQLVTADGRYVGDAGSGATTTVVSAFVDLADSNLGNIPVTGDLVVDGPGAVGIDIRGNNNRIANLPGFGRAGDLPPIGEGTPILAQGVGSIGVHMVGSGNTLLNYGTITGDLYSIEDGAGDNTVIQGGYLFGDVDLGAGDDSMVVRQGAQLSGVASGGPGSDRLIAAMLSPIPGSPVGEGHLNASQYVHFEDFQKVGDNRLVLDGTLDVATATVRRGEMRLGSSAVITGNTVLDPGTLLTGSGSLGGLTVSPGATVSPGTSPGRIDIAGDLSLMGGTLAFEIGATPDRRDLITVGGVALFQGGTIELTFIDGFLPTVDDIFDVLIANSTIGLSTLTFDVFGLGSGLDLIPDFGTAGRLAFRTVPTAAAVPEPSNLLLLLAGLVSLVVLWRWRNQPVSRGQAGRKAARH